MRLTCVISILLCFSASYSTQVIANTMLTEPALKQCISYTHTMDTQEDKIDELNNVIDEALLFINLAEMELEDIKYKLEDAEQQEASELVEQYNAVNTKRNQSILDYQEAHQTRQQHVQLYNEMLKAHNRECVNVRVTKVIYDKACKGDETSGFCSKFKFD